MARAEAKKTTSDLIIERLLAWGGDTCFGIRGDQVNGFFESPRTHPGMRFTHVRHEENAALACVGYAKFTGRPAACVATAGPGAIHLLNGLYDARIDGAPVIAITASRTTTPSARTSCRTCPPTGSSSRRACSPSA